MIGHGGSKGGRKVFKDTHVGCKDIAVKRVHGRNFPAGIGAPWTYDLDSVNILLAIASSRLNLHQLGVVRTFTMGAWWRS